MTTDGPRHEQVRDADRRSLPPEQRWLTAPSGRDGLIPGQRQVGTPDRAPDTIAGWKALVEGLLTDQCCAFPRNMEISARYAWLARGRSPHDRASLQRVSDEARDYASMPCVLPHLAVGGEAPPTAWQPRPREEPG